MTTPTLAIYGFGYQLDKIKYPWREAIQSAIVLCGGDELGGAVFFAACDDETYEAAFERFSPAIEAGILQVRRHEWTVHHTGQAHLANFLLDQIGTEFRYSLKLDMDEVLNERSFLAFRSDLRFMRDTGVVLGRPRYTHYLTENLCTQFIYRSKAVISKTKAGLRFRTGIGDDACALGGASEFQTQLEVAHYGKYAVGREREAIYKEYTFQQGYRELGFPDPLVVKQYEGQGYADYDEIFQAAKSRGEFYECNDPHPIFVQKWLEESKVRSAEFWKGRERAH